MALGEGGSTRCIEALRAALLHPDARVQANAVEALVKRGASETADLISFITDSRHNRSRANAIVAMYRVDRNEGEYRLREMLGDENPMHRVSALWAVRRARVTNLIEVVQCISEQDELRPVRRRAGETLRMLRGRPMISTSGATAI